MASDFKPTMGPKDAYAGAPDEYYKMVLKAYVPTAEHPLPPIPEHNIFRPTTRQNILSNSRKMQKIKGEQFCSPFFIFETARTVE